jgi:hypothetical protein
MQPTPPGWYWDPGNRPGLFRWWDGHDWGPELTARWADPPPHAPRLPVPDADGRHRSAGLSFPVLPDSWVPCPGYPDLDDVHGQEIVVGTTPRGPYVGAVFLGGLPASYGYAGSGTLAAAGEKFADAMLHSYYPHEHPHAGLEPETLDVAGRAAWRLVVPLDIEDDHLDLTEETALFQLIGFDDHAGVLFASLPTVAGVPSASEVLAALAVEG